MNLFDHSRFTFTHSLTPTECSLVTFGLAVNSLIHLFTHSSDYYLYLYEASPLPFIRLCKEHTQIYLFEHAGPDQSQASASLSCSAN